MKTPINLADILSEQSPKFSKSLVKWQFLPYAILGALIFLSSSNLEVNPYLQVYITLLETKLGLALVYLVIKRLKNKLK